MSKANEKVVDVVDPFWAPSTLRTTELMVAPDAAAAVPLMVIAPETVAPFNGEVMVTCGTPTGVDCTLKVSGPAFLWYS